jgi:peptidoglycan/xylan/chitin deacetylase (PgdA/CDA1 family)
MMLRTAVKTATAWAISRTGFDEIARVRRYRHLPFVLGYHRVVERLHANNGFALPAMEISVAMFERHLDWLASHFRIVSLDDLGANLQKPPGSKPLAAVTFDDGYSDIYHYAFPLLKRKGIPAGIFVVTELVGATRLPIHEELYGVLAGREPDPFSATRSLLRRLPQSEIQRIVDSLQATTTINERARLALQPLSWEMLMEMHKAGMTIGSHSKTHAFLANESEERVREEVEGSRRELQRRLEVRAEWFAYPGGSFNPSVIRAVARAGYRYAFTDCRHRDPNHPLLTLPRKGLWERSCLDPFGRFSPAIMSCHAAAIFDRFADCTNH